VVIPALATLVVDALEHRGLCDRDQEPVLGRARDMAAAFASAAAAAAAAAAAEIPAVESPAAESAVAEPPAAESPPPALP
jgi:hypothetical protein